MLKYEAVRRAVFIEGLSRRAAARKFGLNERTVTKMCAFSAPPGYRLSQPKPRPKLDQFVGVIDAILTADITAPVKQRHTAKRIFDRLRDEHGFSGGYTIVKDYVRDATIKAREMFVPLAHPPGHAQVDFGEAVAFIGAAKQKIHFFCMDLPHSDGCFVKAYPAETTEAFLDGHVSAFEFFQGVPQSILYDNTKIAVARILGDGQRVRSRAFSELVSHYLFADKFGRPGKGNDKGNVEGLVKYARRNFMVPLPNAGDFDALNAMLREACIKRQADVVRGSPLSIGERLSVDQAALSDFPAGPFEPCETCTPRVSAFSLVRYRGNDYSVPTRYGHRDVVVKGFVDEVVISCEAQVIARHKRSYAKADFIFEPRHYLALIEQKTRALDQAAPLQNWDLPADFADFRQRLEARMGVRGRREYVQVLRLTEHFSVADIAAAIRKAAKTGAISFDAVRHLATARAERRVVKLDLSAYPHLPRPNVQTTRAADYMVLMGAHARPAQEGRA